MGYDSMVTSNIHVYVNPSYNLLKDLL
jgi:hypothetical protein